jgi:hypothetical protein
MRIVEAISLGLMAGLLLCVGCSRQEPRSVIIEKAEKAGAGDLSAASSPAMQKWLGKHREIAIEIESMCKPVRKAATAQWADSTEGRLCAASNELAFFRSAPARGDGRVFRPGVK